MHITRLALLTALALLLGGCATQWVKVASKDTLHKGDGYTLQAPGGWVKRQLGDTLLITRDGPGLQRILVRVASHEKAFENLKKPSSPKQLPSELADLYMANLRKEDEDGIPSLQVLSNEPATVADHDAFRIHLSYRTGSGLRRQIIAYGFVTEKHFVTVSFTAPTLHYFDRDKDKLDGVVRSLKLS